MGGRGRCLEEGAGDEHVDERRQPVNLGCTGSGWDPDNTILGTDLCFEILRVCLGPNGKQRHSASDRHKQSARRRRAFEGALTRPRRKGAIRSARCIASTEIHGHSFGENGQLCAAQDGGSRT